MNGNLPNIIENGEARVEVERLLSLEIASWRQSIHWVCGSCFSLSSARTAVWISLCDRSTMPFEFGLLMAVVIIFTSFCLFLW